MWLCLEAAWCFTYVKIFFSNLRIATLDRVDHEMFALSCCFHASLWLAQLSQSNETSDVTGWVCIYSSPSTLQSTFALSAAAITWTKIAGVFGDAHTVCAFKFYLFTRCIELKCLKTMCCFTVVFSQKCPSVFTNLSARSPSALSGVLDQFSSRRRKRREKKEIGF